MSPRRLGPLLLWLAFGLALTRQVQTGFHSFLLAFDHCAGMGCDYNQYYRPQAALLVEGRLTPGWTSPPLLALLFAAQPFGGKGWLAVNLVASLLLVAACWRRVGAVALPLVGLSLPVWHAIKWGQPSLVLAAAAVAISTPEWLPTGRVGGSLRGAVFGLLAALKLYPGLWLVADLSARRWRVLGVAVVTGVAAGVVLPALLLPGDLDQRMWSSVWAIQVANRAQTVAQAAWLGGQGLPASLYRWFTDSHLIPADLPQDPGVIYLSAQLRTIVEALAAVAVVACLARLRRAAEIQRAAAAMLGVTVLLNPGWHHYFAFLPWAQAVAWATLPAGARARALLGISIALSSLGMLGLADLDGLYRTLTGAGATTLSALAALGALIFARAPEDALQRAECYEPT